MFLRLFSLWDSLISYLNHFLFDSNYFLLVLTYLVFAADFLSDLDRFLLDLNDLLSDVNYFLSIIQWIKSLDKTATIILRFERRTSYIGKDRWFTIVRFIQSDERESVM